MIEAIYDVLHYLVFGPDIPYLTKSLTGIEIALIASAIKAGSDVAQGAFLKSKAKKQREEGEKIAQDAEDAIRDLNIGVSQESRDLAELQKQQAEDLQSLIRQNQMAQSQQAIASSMGDPTRTASAVSPLLNQLNQQSLQQNLMLGQQKTEADQQLADLTERYNRANLQKNLMLEGQLRREGQAAASLGYASETEAGSQMVGSLGEGADTFGSIYTMAEQGGNLSNQIYKTGGEFNHDTNKKALIDEETGEKEAELTGKELVLNPKQTESTMSAVDKLFKILESVQLDPSAKKELGEVAELLRFFQDPQFQGPDEVQMPEDAVEEGEIKL